MWIDSHAHLDMEAFDQDREEVIARAFQKGVFKIITIGTDLESSRRALSLAQAHDRIWATIGIHPHDAKERTEQDFSRLAELACEPRVVAVGETGLDFFRNLSPKEDQKDCFRKMIRLARETSLPLVIHDRQAHEEVLTILREEKAGEIGGIFHCFSGDWDMAQICLDLNFFISITGAITFKEGTVLEEVVRRAPLGSLLIETDAPYLTPHPYRGKRNEPAYVAYTADYVARIRNMPPLELSRALWENTHKAFRNRLGE